jgi:hypothetical protein
MAVQAAVIRGVGVTARQLRLNPRREETGTRTFVPVQYGSSGVGRFVVGMSPVQSVA